MNDIRTLIFVDFETAGSWLEKREIEHVRVRELVDEADFSQHLEKLVKSDLESCRFPRLSEMCFLSVPRILFEEAAENMVHLMNKIEEAVTKGTHLEDESIKMGVAANLCTCQLNPKLDEDEWKAYELEGRSNRLRRFELEQKNSFAEEWPLIHQMLTNAPKPACLVAHNGLQFDFRILLHELNRSGIMCSHPIPDGVFFVDSYLAFVSIERDYHRSMKMTVENIDWTIVRFQRINEQNLGWEFDEQQRIRQPAISEVELTGGGDKAEKDGDEIQYLGADCHFEVKNQCAKQQNRAETAEKTQSEAEEEITILEVHLKSRDNRGKCWQSSPSNRISQKASPAGQSFDNAHPIRFLRRNDWCPAKRRRIPTRILHKGDGGQWSFSEQVSTICLNQSGRYKLEKMYRNIIGSVYKAHRAQSDSEALLQVSLAYGPDFLRFVDEKHAKFPNLMYY